MSSGPWTPQPPWQVFPEVSGEPWAQTHTCSRPSSLGTCGHNSALRNPAKVEPRSPWPGWLCLEGRCTVCGLSRPWTRGVAAQDTAPCAVPAAGHRYPRNVCGRALSPGAKAARPEPGLAGGHGTPCVIPKPRTSPLGREWLGEAESCLQPLVFSRKLGHVFGCKMYYPGIL